MKKFLSSLVLIVLIFIFTNFTYSQLYQGPAAGTLASGVAVSTDNFGDSFSGEPLPNYLVKDKYNVFNPAQFQQYNDNMTPTGPEGSNFVQDKSAITDEFDSPSILLNNFPGIPRTNFVPPDPSVAAGPMNIVGGVNSTFRIWDKQGNILKTINGDGWYASLGLGLGGNLSDPKITYDHFAKRWIIAWITGPIGPFSYDVISVSDDSNAIGTWYNYAFRSDENGNTPVGVWRDYEGIGFDASAIYIVGNGFGIASGSFAYAKMRIINKAQLYANTGGSVSYNDIWDIRDPATTGDTYGIRPTITYGNPNEEYLLFSPYFGSSNHISLFKIINPLTTPSMTGVSISVTTFSSPPNSSQLGTTQTITAGGTCGFRNEPVYRNGYLHGVKAVRYNGSYAAFNYYKINVATNLAEQDIAFGADNFYYSYPAVSVDANDNVLVSFSRSATTEYIGAYYTSRLSTDPPNTFNPSVPLKAGIGTYINTGSSDRWGDYMGSWLDPVTSQDFWIMTEFADQGNNWGTWVGNVKLSPYATARIFSDKDSMAFGSVEVNTNSIPQNLKVENYGNTTLTISAIQSLSSDFRITNPPALPVNLGFGDSVILNIIFNPLSTGLKSDSIKFTSNDVTNPDIYVHVKGKGYVINPAQVNTIYGVTGTQSNGILLTINSTTGTGTSVGQSGYSQLNGLSIRPSNNQLYASITGGNITQLVRINATAGDAYNVAPLTIANIRSIAFDLNDLLFCSTPDGKIYKYNVSTFDTVYIGNTAISNLFGLTINPVNGSMWGMSATGALYKINKQTGVAQTVGSTGVSPNTDIAFSKTGKLYGISGIGVSVNKLITIDTTTGTGSVIGTNTGITGINGLAISPEIVGIQNITTSVPQKFELGQNYPNPFNPVTHLEFGISAQGLVSLKIYDALGREVETLVNEKLSPGRYEVEFNGANYSSGIYFYKMETNNFTETKKMLLIK